MNKTDRGKNLTEKRILICSSVILSLFLGANYSSKPVRAAENANGPVIITQQVQQNKQNPSSEADLQQGVKQENQLVQNKGANSLKQQVAKADEEQSQQTTKVVIHYQGDGENWKPYVWGENPGANGQQYDWSGKDENGYYANIDVQGNHESVGILIKGKDNWNKDGSNNDRHQAVNAGGKAEVFYKQGSDQPQNVVPVYKKAKINLHYDDRYAKSFSYWTDTDTHKQTVDFDQADTEGYKNSSFSINAPAGFKKIFVQPLYGAQTSFTPIADNVATDIYLEPNDKTAYYTKSFAQASDTIISASVSDLNTIHVRTGAKMSARQAATKLHLSDNGIKNIVAVNQDADGDSNQFTLTTTQPIDILKNNRIGINGHQIGFDIGDYVRSKQFDDLYYYDGDDLGATYSKQNTQIKLWAPTANKVILRLYDSVDNNATPTKEVALKRGDKGVWSTDLLGNYQDWAYDYQLSFGNGVTNISNDPYSKAVTVNGVRSVIEDVNNIKPKDFKRMPSFGNPTNAIIYETSIRDFTSDANSGVKDKGKFLGMIESGKTKDGQVTGLAYLKKLGITHVQIMPSFDFASVDETKDLANQYNWGYDPQNYDVPEGSYSTNPYDPKTRILEMKEMINGLHKAGIRVIMDVVFNHVYNTQTQAFNLTVPGYYFRYDHDQPTNYSGCGNDVNTQEKMARKYVLDSVKYWATNYNIDGFRFDIMSILDLKTMQDVRAELNKIDPGIITYGEGWDMNNYTKTQGTSQPNADKVPGVGFFSDDMRNSVKGADGSDGAWGLVLGDDHELNHNLNATRFTDSFIRGEWLHNDAWEPHNYLDPGQMINYVACHDGQTLYDYIKSRLPNESDAEIAKRVRLANTMVMLSEGVPFFQSGQEALRTKGGNSNSYNSPISINEIDWDRIHQFKDSVSYFAKIAQLRKELSVLRQDNFNKIDRSTYMVSYGRNPADKDNIPGIFEYEYTDQAGKKLLIVFNVNNKAVTLSNRDLTNGKILLDSEGNTKLGKSTTVAPLSSLVVDESGTMDLNPKYNVNIIYQGQNGQQINKAANVFQGTIYPGYSELIDAENEKGAINASLPKNWQISGQYPRDLLIEKAGTQNVVVRIQHMTQKVNPTDPLKQKDLFKEVTRTINVYKPGTSELDHTETQTVRFDRTATLDLVTGQYLANGFSKWQLESGSSSSWNAYEVPQYNGYSSHVDGEGLASDARVIPAAVGLDPSAASVVVNVTYVLVNRSTNPSSVPTVPVNNQSNQLQSSASTSEQASESTAATTNSQSNNVSPHATQNQVQIRLTHNAYIYTMSLSIVTRHNKKVILKVGKHINAWNNGRKYLLKGKQYYRIGQNEYIKVANTVSYYRLKHNSFVYDKNGKAVKKNGKRILLKKGRRISLRKAAIVKIGHKKLYELRRGNYIRSRNVVKILAEN